VERVILNALARKCGEGPKLAFTIRN